MIYKIKKGNHRSGLHFHPVFFKDSLEFTFKLSKDCWFEPKEEDDFDINKIYGVSFGMHHKDSARIGWTPTAVKDVVKILLYTYNNSIRSSYIICNVKVDEEERVIMYFNKEDSCITLNMESDCILVPYKFPKNKFGYRLFPYFGGNKTAHENLEIEIKVL